MKTICKQSEPRSLTQHRTATHSSYSNFGGKKDLRVSLVAEQGGLCCYCMGRIRPDATAMKIEHWQCQDRFEARQLDYGNLLGACLGGDGMPRHKQHCDTRKGSADLAWNPADPTHMIECRICYGADGTISSDDGNFCKQLDDVLNLNLKILKNNRKGILDAIIIWWKSEKGRIKGPVPKTTFQRELGRLLDDGTELRPYSGVAVWWLQQRLARMS